MAKDNALGENEIHRDFSELPAPLPLPLAACGEPPFPGGHGLLRTAFEGGGSTFSSGGVPTLGFPAARSLPGGTISNAFGLSAGSYNGLFYDTNGVAVPSAGYFSAITTTRGHAPGVL